MISESQSEADKYFCHFGPYFDLLPPPNDPEYQNFEKNEKITWRYYPFIYICV